MRDSISHPLEPKQALVCKRLQDRFQNTRTKACPGNGLGFRVQGLGFRGDP